MIMIAAAAFLADPDVVVIAPSAPPVVVIAPSGPSPQQRAYSEWGGCLEAHLPPDRFMTAPRITDRAMTACLRYELAYSEAQRRWVAAANLDEVQRREVDREYNRSVRRMRRMIEEEAQQIQDQAGNR